MAAPATTNAEKNKPYMLAFFFAPEFLLDVTAEIQPVESETKTVLSLPRNVGLSNQNTWVYMAWHTFTSIGWHVVHYRANNSSDGLLTTSDIRRILVVDPETSDAPTELTRVIQEGMKVTAFNSVIMNNRGILSFKTRTK